MLLLDGRSETGHLRRGLGAAAPERARVLHEPDESPDEDHNEDDPEDGELALSHRGFSASTMRIWSCAPSPTAAGPPLGCLISQLFS